MLHKKSNLGWLFPSTEVLSRNEFSEVNHNLNSNSNKYTQLLQRVNNLSESFVNFTEILKDDFANLVDRIDQVIIYFFFKAVVTLLEKS